MRAERDILAPIDLLLVIERAFPERLVPVDDAVDALRLGVDRLDRVAVRRILHLCRPPCALVDILDHDSAPSMVKLTCIESRSISRSISSMVGTSRHSSRIDRDGVAEPEMLRARRRQDLVQRIRHGDGRRKAIIERVAARIAAGGMAHDGIEIDLADRQARSGRIAIVETSANELFPCRNDRRPAESTELLPPVPASSASSRRKRTR